MSGVEVDTECKKIFDQMKEKYKHRYIIFHIDAGKIRIEKIGARESSYDDFLSDLKKKTGDIEDCRYGCYDIEFTIQSQGTDSASYRNKLFLVLWCPAGAKIKPKMVYTSSFDSIKRALVGVHKVFQANDNEDIERDTVLEKFISSART